MLATALLMFAAAPTGAVAPLVDVTTIVGRFRPGTRLGSRRGGPLCGPDGDLKWRRDLGDGDLDDIAKPVRAALRAAGYPTLAATEELFVPAMPTAGERLLAGEIIAISGSLCDTRYTYPKFWPKRRGPSWHGKLLVVVRWTMYDATKRAVIHTVQAEGYAAAERADPAYAGSLLTAAVVSSAKTMLTDPDAQAALR